MSKYEKKFPRRLLDMPRQLIKPSMDVTDGAVNSMLDNLVPSGASQAMLSLHNGYSASGANMIGNKTATTFSAASGRSKSLTAAQDIAVPSADTVRWIGVWSADGNTFKGMTPNGGSAMSFQVDTTGERILCEGHGLSNDMKCAFFGGTPPGGLSRGTEYYVIAVTAADPDTFQVSTQPNANNSPINLTSNAGAGCMVSKLVPEIYSGAGTHRINTHVISI